MSVFGNIAYPLLWNDEAETAAFAQRIINYGYPKVHDGKNVLNLTDYPQPEVGIKKEIDAFITISWGHFYAAVPGVLLANLTNNLYLKTSLVRIPFVIYGLIGLALLFLAVAPLFSSRSKILSGLNIFLLLEIFSLVFTLHVREVKSYSLTLMLVGALLFFYLRYYFFNSLSYRYYFFGIFFSLWLIFFTFFPLYFILMIVLSLHLIREIIKVGITKEGEISKLKKTLNSQVDWQSIKELIKALKMRGAEIFNRNIFFRAGIKKYFHLVAPVWLSLILVVPAAVFFETFTAVKSSLGTYELNWQSYSNNLRYIFSVFSHYEMLYWLILLRVLALFSIWYRNNRPGESNNPLFLKIANFFSLLAIAYFFIFVRPNYLFVRYYLFLQPILALIIVLDLAIIYDFLRWQKKIGQRSVLTVFFVSLAVIFTSHGFLIRDFITGHLYELSHQYQGPLDFAIPFIQSKFPDTKSITIATNYEEPAYMYYLDSKVIIGLVGNNLAEDKKIQPEVIIFRRGYDQFKKIFDDYLQKSKYTAYTLPVYDYHYNNLPEPGWHLYKTKLAEKDEEKLTIFIKEE